MPRSSGEKKESFEEVRSQLVPLAVASTDGAFYIAKDGSTIDVYAECDNPEGSCWHGRLPAKLGGWRIIMYNCPTGYIDCFIKPKAKNA